MTAPRDLKMRWQHLRHVSLIIVKHVMVVPDYKGRMRVGTMCSGRDTWSI